MAGAHKKIVVRMVTGPPVWGYLPSTDWLKGDIVHIMQVDGRVKHISFSEVELICYVRDFNLDDPVEPEKLGRRAFLGRPREEGLWIRVGLRSQAPLEGVIVVDLAMLDGFLEDRGLTMSPPNSRGNTSRIFIPRHAVRSMEVLGLVGSPAKKQAARAAERAAMELQAGLFEDS